MYVKTYYVLPIIENYILPHTHRRKVKYNPFINEINLRVVSLADRMGSVNMLKLSF